MGGLQVNGGTILYVFGCDIFFLSSLSIFSALLEDVLECTTRAYTVFPCGPSAAAVVSAARYSWSQFATHAGIPPLPQSVPSDFTWLWIEQQNPASPFRQEKYVCKVTERTKSKERSRDAEPQIK